MLGHELGHHLADHLGRRRARGVVAGTAAGTLLGALVPFGGLAGWALGEGAALAGSQGAQLAISKEEEREADYLGAYLVARAGYDLDRAGLVWVRLTRGGPQETAGLLDSHPAGPERLAAWRQATAEIRLSRRDAAAVRPAGPILSRSWWGWSTAPSSGWMRAARRRSCRRVMSWTEPNQGRQRHDGLLHRRHAFQPCRRPGALPPPLRLRRRAGAAAAGRAAGRLRRRSAMAAPRATASAACPAVAPLARRPVVFIGRPPPSCSPVTCCDERQPHPISNSPSA